MTVKSNRLLAFLRPPEATMFEIKIFQNLVTRSFGVVRHIFQNGVTSEEKQTSTSLVQVVQDVPHQLLFGVPRVF